VAALFAIRMLAIRYGLRTRPALGFDAIDSRE